MSTYRQRQCSDIYAPGAKAFEQGASNFKKQVMTTDAWRPVGANQNSLTVGPQRVVHAKKLGAHGHFVCTSKDITRYTTAKLFGSVGKKTPTFIRFSTVGGEKDRQTRSAI